MGLVLAPLLLYHIGSVFAIQEFSPYANFTTSCMLVAANFQEKGLSIIVDMYALLISVPKECRVCMHVWGCYNKMSLLYRNILK